MLSVTLAVKTAGTPAMTVSGPVMAPTGATMSGIVFPAVVVTSAPFEPPTAPRAPSIRSTAFQSAVARGLSAFW
jgi:hypothetical protein